MSNEVETPEPLEHIEGETPNERFLRLVNFRLPKLVKRMRQIGNLSGANYDYTPEQAQAIMEVIDTEVATLRQKFEKVKVEDSVPTIL